MTDSHREVADKLVVLAEYMGFRVEFKERRRRSHIGAKVRGKSILVYEPISDEVRVSVLAHEFCHAACRWLQWPRTGAEEGLAYAFQYFFMRTMFNEYEQHRPSDYFVVDVFLNNLSYDLRNHLLGAIVKRSRSPAKKGKAYRLVKDLIEFDRTYETTAKNAWKSRPGLGGYIENEDDFVESARGALNALFDLAQLQNSIGRSNGS